MAGRFVSQACKGKKSFDRLRNKGITNIVYVHSFHRYTDGHTFTVHRYIHTYTQRRTLTRTHIHTQTHTHTDVDLPGLRGPRRL
jgi:hypothetical protein